MIKSKTVSEFGIFQVLETFPSPTNGLPVARALRTSVTKEYAVKLFDSCSEVTAFGGMSAIALICGDMDCTYEVSCRQGMVVCCIQRTFGGRC